jgi:hypothetical protein
MSNDSNSNEILIEQFAERVVRFRLEAPAIFFLELYKPLTTLAYAVAEMSMPLIMCVLEAEKRQQFMALLADRATVERVITAIEKRYQEYKLAKESHRAHP